MIAVGQDDNDAVNNKYENKIAQLQKKIKYEKEHDLRDNSHFDFQGGVLKYHQWVTLTVGSIFMLLALVYQQGSFLYFYIFGLIKVLKDTVDAAIQEEIRLSPLIYYLFAGFTILIIMKQAGYPVPEMTYGIAANTIGAL